MAKHRHIGILAGSFDPLHIGHMAIANYAIENSDIDQVWIMPTPHNPTKRKAPSLPLELRKEIIREVIKDDERFALCTIEESLPAPYYSIRTLQALHMLYPDIRFSLIIGADNYASFEQWKEYERIAQMCQLIVYPRIGSTLVASRIEEVQYLPEAPLIQISSTAIRQAAQNGKCYDYWLCKPNSWEMIYNYFNTTHD